MWVSTGQPHILVLPLSLTGDWLPVSPANFRGLLRQISPAASRQCGLADCKDQSPRGSVIPWNWWPITQPLRTDMIAVLLYTSRNWLLIRSIFLCWFTAGFPAKCHKFLLLLPLISLAYQSVLVFPLGGGGKDHNCVNSALCRFWFVHPWWAWVALASLIGSTEGQYKCQLLRTFNSAAPLGFLVVESAKKWNRLGQIFPLRFPFNFHFLQLPYLSPFSWFSKFT